MRTLLKSQFEQTNYTLNTTGTMGELENHKKPLLILLDVNVWTWMRAIWICLLCKNIFLFFRDTYWDHLAASWCLGFFPYKNKNSWSMAEWQWLWNLGWVFGCLLHCLYESGSNEAKTTWTFKAEGLETEYWLHRRWETGEPSENPEIRASTASSGLGGQCQDVLSRSPGPGVTSPSRNQSRLLVGGGSGITMEPLLLGALPKAEKRRKPCSHTPSLLQCSLSAKHNFQSKWAC